MDAAQLALTTAQVLLCTFALSIALGAVLQATHFCTMGAISDMVLMRDPIRLQQWALAAAVAMPLLTTIMEAAVPPTAVMGAVNDTKGRGAYL